MADTTSNLPKAPLGVGSLIAESFSILFGKFIPVVLMALIPTALGLVIGGLLIGFGAMTGTAAPDIGGPLAGFGFVLSTLIQLVVYGFATALLVQLAYDAKLNREITTGEYISNALRTLAPVVILSIVVGIGVGLASIAFVIPGLWLYAVWAVTVPAIVIEGAGFGGLGRSATLTKEYRWPIVGAWILITICTMIFTFVGTFMTGLIAVPLLGMVLYAVLTAIGTGLAGIFAALVYARLREIKEGVSVDQIASVFD